MGILGVILWLIGIINLLTKSSPRKKGTVYRNSSKSWYLNHVPSALEPEPTLPQAHISGLRFRVSGGKRDVSLQKAALRVTCVNWGG